MYRVCGCAGRVGGSRLMNLTRTDMSPKLRTSLRGVTSRKESPEPCRDHQENLSTSADLGLGKPTNLSSGQNVSDRIQISNSGVPLNHYDGLLKVLTIHQARLRSEFGMRTVNMADVAFAIPPSLETEFGKLRKEILTSGATKLGVAPRKRPEIDLQSEQYSIELDELNQDIHGISTETQETVNPKSKVEKRIKGAKKEAHDPKVPSPVREAQRLYQQKQVIVALQSFVEASVLSGELSQAAAIVHFQRKKFLKTLPPGCSHPIPTSVYNSLLSGYANTGNFTAAMALRKLMVTGGTPLDASSYSYLLAVSNDRGTKLILALISSMSAQKLTLERLFQETTFTKIQRENLIKAIRRVQPGFEAPVKMFPANYNCEVLKNLKPRRVKGPGPDGTKAVPLKLMVDGAEEQWNREVNGIVKVKSVLAEKAVKPHVLFLRNQVASLEAKWSEDIRQALDRELRNLENHKKLKCGMTLYPYLHAVDAKTIVKVLLHEVRTMALSSETYSPSMTQMCDWLGQRVNGLYVIAAKTKYGITPKCREIYLDYLKMYDLGSTRPDREIWQELLSRHSAWGPTIEGVSKVHWPKSVLIGLGRFLFQVLRSLQLDINILKPENRPAVMVNAIYTIYRNHDNQIGKKEESKPHPTLAKLYNDAQLEHLHFDAKIVPMLCPPRPWCHPTDTPFLLSQVPFVRLPFEDGSQRDLMEKAPLGDLYPSFDALNVVSRCPWIINKPMLQLVTEVFLQDGNLKLDIPQPPSAIPEPPAINSVPVEEQFKARQELSIYHRKCSEAYSLWCDMLYKLSIADHFKDNVFWFPHNMDFRGRVYPCPPHFSHIGSDVMRGCLLFAEGKPLGPNGFNWLKLHLVNLTGFRKRHSVADRLQYADEIMDDVLDSADNPFTGRKWWQTSDKPWQTLAACMEVANIIRSGKDPSECICHFPIHQDGSCNGLQHYAALGRDLQGAEQVNLRPMDLPQDVYSGIAEMVEQQRIKDAEAGKQIAHVLEGHIQRKVVKQTVMTVVYGVTFFGAKLQILRQLNDIENFPQQHGSAAATYLAEKVFFSLRKMFTATREIQDWFTNCAKLIAKIRGQPISWVTPLGLPVVQPYFVPAYKTSVVSYGESLPNQYIDYYDTQGKPNANKQKNAFPPNFVHSLDSSHMMLTAIHSQAAGITFVSVHDCFWTHPSTVETMNVLCREQFVALHSQPILYNLSQHLEKQFGYSADELLNDGSLEDIVRQKLNKALRQIPPQGKFNLNEVLDSVYFFG